MKEFFVLLLLALSGPSLAQASGTSQNRYVCVIFEPNMQMLEVRVSPENPYYEHLLVDRVHRLEVQWWDWTLNLSLAKKGQVLEVLGAASPGEVRLRSANPSMSVHCRLE